MGLDIRLPIGSMFLFVGVLLTVYGAVRPLASTSVGININLTWGLVLLVFGIVMVLLGRHGSRALKMSESSREVPARGRH
jgi:hypothetical protein